MAMPNFDPTKLDPQTMRELTELLRELPPDRLNQLQSLMHNMMAGFDVRAQMEEFERSLPPGFRDKLFSLMIRSGVEPGSPGPMAPQQPSTPETDTTAEETAASTENMDLREARLTILRAVASGKMTPEQAESLLFQEPTAR